MSNENHDITIICRNQRSGFEDLPEFIKSGDTMTFRLSDDDDLSPGAFALVTIPEVLAVGEGNQFLKVLPDSPASVEVIETAPFGKVIELVLYTEKCGLRCPARSIGFKEDPTGPKVGN